MGKASALELVHDDVGLILIDAQVRLANAMPQEPIERALRNWLTLLDVAARLALPVGMSEQYPQGLGPTVAPLRDAVARLVLPVTRVEKIEFSLADVASFQRFLDGSRRTLVVCGMECHVCVYQTVRGLLDKGFKVHVPVDGVVSRAKTNWKVGLDLMARAGAIITSTETILFDLLKRAGGDDFRAVSKLIK